MSHRKILTSLSIMATALVLTACQATTTEHASKDPLTVTKSNPRTQSAASVATSTKDQKIDSALNQAAIESAVRGNKRQSLSYLEKLYVRNPQDPAKAINYASALRRAKEYERAAIILDPIANNPDMPSVAKTEFAAIQLALGNNKQAEQFAQKAVLQNENDFRAYHYLGIALDAEGRHPEAERAFRKGLAIWQGDPIPIMNNLALNLTAQNNLNEALKILERAKTIAPKRIEVERNLRIVRALKETYEYSLPKAE